MDDKESILKFEKELWDRGYRFIAGVDEAGRGPIAGPVVAAAVIFGPYVDPFVFRDSKRLSAGEREKFFRKIIDSCVSFGIGIADSLEIDRFNILNATRAAMSRAIDKLNVKPDFVITDAVKLSDSDREMNIVKGDEKSFSCACASILAKVSRDFLMIHLARLFPEYGFESNKGYPTKKHLRAVGIYGACPVHRLTFRGVRGVEKGTSWGRTGFPLSVEERLQYFEKELQKLLGRN